MSTEKNTKQKKSIKNTLRNLLVLVLVAVISIAGTLAFLQDQTGKKVNTFTGSPGIDLKLTEPNYEEDKAGSYTPGMVIQKDPTLTNNSVAATGTDEWVAIRVDYTFANNPVTRNWLETNVIETIEIDANNWYKLPTKSGDADTVYEIYLYKNLLSQNETVKLFEQVQIKSQDDLADDVYDSGNNKYKDFKITVCGAAIKNDKTLSLTAITENDISTPINMNDLSNAVTTTSKDSQKVAVALATLLQNPATIELNKDGTIKTNS